jgi:type VI secretion system secreted protein VgrG
MDRTFKAHSPLGEQLLFRSLAGSEQISRLFEFRVKLLSESDSISAKSLLGQDMSIEIDLTTEKNGGGKRFLSGQIAKFDFDGRDGDFFSYSATLRPWLWLATRRSDFKIFQFKTVPVIVQEILAPYGFTVINKLTGNYRSWDYCVQYGETDFNFISRLLEAEGAYFYFEHQQGSHKLVLADGIGSHSPLPNGPTTIPYYPGTRAAHVHDEDFMDGWESNEDIASGHFAADDYDFEKPKALLDTKQQQPAGHSQDSWEIYDWPGGYTQVGDGENYARVRIEQLKAEREAMQGRGNARNLAPGYLFSLSKYPRGDQNQQYLIESADYRFDENVHRSDGGSPDSATRYRLNITVVPSKVAYRSQRATPKPHTTGPQTAEVVGPPGEEIYTDKYGRVKVQFHWDRYGKKDENSSCWIRVSSPWAGSNYGAIHLPRIGQEVVVDFLNGDPDYPIITGRVYNADQMPPWELPANKTQSGIKTRSSKDGTPGSGEKATPGMTNVIRFEDQAGSEQLWFHAQKDQLTEVENDEDKWVGQDRRKVIDRDEFNTIHRDRTEIVDRNEKINVHGWRTEEVDLDETITIHQNRTEVVDLNEDITIHENRKERVDHNEKISIGDNRTEDVGKNEKVSIGINQNLKVGSNKQETIGLTSLKNVGIAQMTNIGATYILNVGGMWMSNVGFMHMHNVGSSYKITVGKVYTNEVGAATHKLDSEGNQVLTAAGGAGMINMDKDGVITIKAKKIKIEADEFVDVDGKVIDLN